MSDRRSLPDRPSLRRLRDEAKARRRAGEFPTLSLAQLAIAREYGFASWSRLKLHVDALTLDGAERAEGLVRSACSGNVRRAQALLDVDPALAGHDLACACVTGDAETVARLVGPSPERASAPDRTAGRVPILYACFSRLGRGDPAARGVDPRRRAGTARRGRRPRRAVHARRLGAEHAVRSGGHRRRRRADGDAAGGRRRPRRPRTGAFGGRGALPRLRAARPRMRAAADRGGHRRAGRSPIASAARSTSPTRR